MMPAPSSPGKENETNMVFCKKCCRYHESVTVCPAPIIPARRDYFEDDDKTAEIARLRAENEALREALEKIADDCDAGEHTSIAREALARQPVESKGEPEL